MRLKYLPSCCHVTKGALCTVATAAGLDDAAVAPLEEQNEGAFSELALQHDMETRFEISFNSNSGEQPSSST
jgi:hypothetical protein